MTDCVLASRDHAPRSGWRRRAMGAALLASGALAAAPAAAGECPPGWFCDEDEAAPAPSGSAGTAPPPAPGPEGAPPEAEPPRPRRLPPPRGVAGPPPFPEPPLPEPPPPPAPRRPWRSELGFGLRFQGVLMGDATTPSGDVVSAHPDAGMAGAGIDFRWRMIPHLALDFGFDWFGGNDWYGDPRREQALTVNLHVYVNPRSAVQVYFLAGLGASWAAVERPVYYELNDGTYVEDYEIVNYSYGGMQLGGGLEFRLTRSNALYVDLLGFTRSGSGNGEYVDATTGQVTDSSGGGLVRLGYVFYW